jgi:biopolymer transport protein ExbD
VGPPVLQFFLSLPRQISEFRLRTIGDFRYLTHNRALVSKLSMALRVPVSARIGLLFLLAAVCLYGGRRWWMATRTWVPLDMPVSLAPGHIRSPEFEINLEGSFWVYIEVQRRFDFDGVPCMMGIDRCPGTPAVLRAKWTLSASGRVIARGDTDTYGETSGGLVTMSRGLGVLGLGEGEHYRLDVDVLEDGSRLNAGHPRLKIEQTGYSWSVEANEEWIIEVALILGAFGAALITSGFVGRFRDARVHQQLSLTEPASQAAGVRVEDAQTVSIAGAKGIGWSGRFAETLPLRPRFTGFRSFGLVGGLTWGFLAVAMIVVTREERRTIGLWVHVLKPGVVPEKTDSWTEPLIVRIKDAGPGREPIVYVGSTPTTWDEFSGRLKEELSRRREWVVYVSGDDGVAWANVTQAIDIARALHAKVVLMTPDRSRQDPTVVLIGRN